MTQEDRTLIAGVERRSEETTGHRNQAPAAADSLSPERLRQVAEEVRSFFPQTPREPELVLIDVDPRRIHAFWSVPPSVIEAARRELGTERDVAPMLLRLTPLAAGSTPGSSIDVEVVGLQGQRYIDIWSEARAYFGELGLRRSDGSLVPLASSAKVELPSLGPAENTVPNTESGRGGDWSATPSEPARHPFPLPPSEPPEPMGHPVPLPPSEPAEFDPSALVGGFIPSSGNAEQASPPPDAAAAEKQPQAAGDARALPDSERASGGSDEPSPTPGLPLENVLTLSSYALGREIVDFEVNAELHVFGRARPGTQLHLFGRRVPLRPDGTFSLTRPLPNGALVLSSLLIGKEDGREND